MSTDEIYLAVYSSVPEDSTWYMTSDAVVLLDSYSKGIMNFNLIALILLCEVVVVNIQLKFP